MSKTIPPQVKAVAQREACNSVSYQGKIDNKEIYALGETDEDGEPIPNGLPFLVLWDGTKTTTVSGTKSLELLSSLQ